MKIAFDIRLMRPGCVLLQAALGGDCDTAHAFKTKDWLLAPTPDMRLYAVTKAELQALVDKVNRFHGGTK